MKTLYTVLGVTPDATDDDLNLALGRAKLRYPEAKIATDDNARMTFQAIAQAHKTLMDPAARMAYDARLSRAGHPTTRNVDDASTADGWFANPTTRIVAIISAVVLVIAAMSFYHYRERAKLQREAAERILRLAEEEQKRRVAEEERAASERAARQAQSNARQEAYEERRAREARERELASRDAQNRRDYQQEQSQKSRDDSAKRQAEYERQRSEREQQEANRRSQMEAERRMAQDKQKLREVCMQRYNRPDC